MQRVDEALWVVAGSRTGELVLLIVVECNLFDWTERDSLRATVRM